MYNSSGRRDHFVEMPNLPADLPTPPADGCAGGCAAEPRLTKPMYSSDEIDELITGQLYKADGRHRAVYAERTSHGDKYGLEEYADGGGEPGDVGYDVGPIGVAPAGLAEGKDCNRTFDDGIPGAWNFPATPVQWYSAIGEDYFGPEGPTVYGGGGLHLMSEGDHDALTN